MISFTFLIAFKTPFPPKLVDSTINPPAGQEQMSRRPHRFASLSLSSTASYSPVEAPLGTEALFGEQHQKSQVSDKLVKPEGSMRSLEIYLHRWISSCQHELGEHDPDRQAVTKTRTTRVELSHTPSRRRSMSCEHSSIRLDSIAQDSNNVLGSGVNDMVSLPAHKPKASVDDIMN
eukprot:334492-Hanusia_phi.AAC.1